jgi:ABC-type multidrug transport system ATPase subunit
VTTALRFSEVRKRFGAVEALRGLDLEVPAGSLFGLIGPNGAGKTTAFSIACGFLREDAGEVALLGGGPFDATRLKGRVTAMPQDAALGRETTCRDHLVFFGRLQGLDRKLAATEADRVLSEMGLSEKAHAKTKTLSHGMLRRLSVAQAFVGTPEIILLDEPTSGLDPRHAHEMRELFRRSRRAGQTLVVSSHNLPELEQLCDHVAFVDRGLAIQSGTTALVTGQGEEVEITLGPGPAPLEALRAALVDATVAEEREPGAGARAGCKVRVRFAPAPGREAEDVIGASLRVLLEHGARISGVRKGRSLETRFLEIV